mgnify:CR=1 FL=1
MRYARRDSSGRFIEGLRYRKRPKKPLVIVLDPAIDKTVVLGVQELEQELNILVETDQEKVTAFMQWLTEPKQREKEA